MKIKVLGDWFGLSFGVFLLVAAIVAIPTGEEIGSLLIRWSNSPPRAENPAQPHDLAEASALPANAAPPASEPHTQASSSTALPAPAASSLSAAPARAKIAPAPTEPQTAALKPAVAAPADAARLQPARLDTSVNPASVSAPVAQTAPAPSVSGTWLQVAAVMQEDSARTLADTLMKKGYPVQVKEPHRDALYRVQVGPYPNRQGAQTAAQALKAEGFQVIVIG